MLFRWLFLFHYFILVFAKAFLRAFSGFWRAFNNLQWISICPISWLLNLRITDQINRKLAFFRFIIPRISKIKLYFATDFSQVWFVFDTLICSSPSAEGYEDCTVAPKQNKKYKQYNIKVLKNYPLLLKLQSETEPPDEPDIFMKKSSALWQRQMIQKKSVSYNVIAVIPAKYSWRGN